MLLQAVEIKQLSAQLASIKSDINRQEDLLEECASYKAFLAQLTPQAWLDVRLPPLSPVSFGCAVIHERC